MRRKQPRGRACRTARRAARSSRALRFSTTTCTRRNTRCSAPPPAMCLKSRTAARGGSNVPSARSSATSRPATSPSRWSPTSAAAPISRSRITTASASASISTAHRGASPAFSTTWRSARRRSAKSSAAAIPASSPAQMRASRTSFPSCTTCPTASARAISR